MKTRTLVCGDTAYIMDRKFVLGDTIQTVYLQIDSLFFIWGDKGFFQYNMASHPLELISSDEWTYDKMTDSWKATYKANRNFSYVATVDSNIRYRQADGTKLFPLFFSKHGLLKSMEYYLPNKEYMKCYYTYTEDSKSNCKDITEVLKRQDAVPLENLLLGGDSTEEILPSGKRVRIKTTNALSFEGDTVSLDALLGKIVYVDIWASWCGPCLAEARYMEELRVMFYDSDIEFLSLSVDTNKGAWYKKVDKMAIKKGQWLLEEGMKSELIKQIGVKGIPRFILLDRNGMVINDNCIRPSNKGIIAYLEHVISSEK